jgi:hypothetical protein
MKINTKYVQCNNAELYKGKYGNGDTALVMKDAATGELLLKVTTNLQAYDVKPKNSSWVFISNYGAHEGLVDALVEADVIEKMGPIHEYAHGFWYEVCIRDIDKIKEL